MGPGEWSDCLSYLLVLVVCTVSQSRIHTLAASNTDCDMFWRGTINPNPVNVGCRNPQQSWTSLITHVGLWFVCGMCASITYQLSGGLGTKLWYHAQLLFSICCQIVKPIPVCVGNLGIEDCGCLPSISIVIRKQLLIWQMNLSASLAFWFLLYFRPEARMNSAKLNNVKPKFFENQLAPTLPNLGLKFICRHFTVGGSKSQKVVG